MAARQPTDEPARRRVRESLCESLLVEAGAGAGKTALIVDRVANLVAAGVAMTSIAAITFTEKAAAELRARIRAELGARLAAGLAADEAGAAVYRDALEVLDEAHIETLHGFAHRLLLAHGMAAGLPPAIELADETEAEIDFERRWAVFLDGLLSLREHAGVMGLAWALGFRGPVLRELAARFHADWDLVVHGDWWCWCAPPGPTVPPAETVPPAPDLAPALAVLDWLCAATGTCRDPDDALAVWLRDEVAPLRGVLGSAQASGDLHEVADALANRPELLAKNRGRKERWPNPTKADVQAAVARLDKMLKESHEGLCAPVLAGLCRRLAEFTAAGVVERRRTGRLEFHDLLVLTRDLLRDNPAVRAALRAELTHLLIDELQDTDPLQFEIAFQLTRREGGPDGGEPGAGPLELTDVEPGRLFLVGDPKQSIYRFRRADIALYRHLRDAAEADVVALGVNFRSVPSLLDCVNVAFARLLGDASSRWPDPTPTQAPWQPLDPHREGDGERAAAVTILGGPVEGPMTMADVRAGEGADVAALCAAVVGEGWSVSAAGDGASPEPGLARPARYDDIAVLIPARTCLPALERAFDARRVPYRVESQALIWATQEVRDLLSLLRAVDDPTDEVALVAALRSPLLACSDRDLVDWRHAGGRWHPLAELPEEVAGVRGGEHPVGQALSTIAAFHAGRWSVDVPTLVERAVAAVGARLLAYGRPRQRESWHRIAFLTDQARAFVDRGGAGLRAFVEWAELQARQGATAVEVVVAEEDDRAVRVLTIHAAKGLEFPVVVLAGINGNPRAPWRPAEVLWPAGRGRGTPPEIRLGSKSLGWRTSRFEAAAARERDLEEEERVRLLYVACTRARDHLVVSLHSRANAETLATKIATALDGVPVERFVPRVERLVPGAVTASSPSGAHSVPSAPDLSAWRAERNDLLARMGADRRVAATSLAAGGAAETPGLDELEADVGTGVETEAPTGVLAWRRGRAATAFGRAVHATLQAVDLATGAGLDELARANAWAEGMAGRAGEVAASVRAARAAPSVREAVAGGRYWREVFVAAEIEGVVVDGYVDLLYESPAGLVVVDYKTDADPDAAAERYAVQVAAYALALEGSIGRRVARTVLLFTRADPALEVVVPDLAAASATCRSLLAAASRAAPAGG